MRRTHLLLSITACLALCGCGLKSPATGSGILTEYGRSQVSSQWSAPHGKGAVTPGWIRTFGDAELSRIVSEALVRNPDLKAAAARVDASRAAVRIAAASLYPQIGLKGLGERQGQKLSGDLGLGI